MRSPSSSSGSSAQRSSVGSGNNVNRGRTSVGCAYTMREQEGCSSAVARTRTTCSISACAFRGWSFVTLPAAHADALRPQPQEQVTSQRAPPALISWTSSVTAAATSNEWQATLLALLGSFRVSLRPGPADRLLLGRRVAAW
jgi:hypothetical protein